MQNLWTHKVLAEEEPKGKKRRSFKATMDQLYERKCLTFCQQMAYKVALPLPSTMNLVGVERMQH